MRIDFELNGAPASVDCEPEKPLLWVLREDLHLTGAKYGCGVAQCGCCTSERLANSLHLVSRVDA